MLSTGLLKVVYIKKRLALDFLNLKAGDCISTITEYQEKFGCSRGSIQIALKELQIEKIVSLKSKGAHGTQIIKLDYNKLLDLLDVNTVIAAMPAPYHLRQEGLASAFMHSFKEAPFRFACSYNQGSLNRIKGLINGSYDFIILSKMASNYYRQIYDFHEIIQLADGSYSAPHLWVVRKGIKKIEPNMRVGIDRTSYDQFFLINKATDNMKLQYVEIRYPSVITNILNGTIDAAVWNMDMIDTFKSEDIDIIDSFPHVEDERAAVVVCKKGRGDIIKIVKDYVKPLIVKKYQEDVMKGLIAPNY